MATKTGTEHSQAYVLAGGYGTLAAVFLLAGVVPYLHGTMAARAAIITAKQDIDARNRQAQQLRDIKAQVELITEQTKDYARLISTEDPALFVQELSKQLNEAGARDIVFLGIQKTPLVYSEKAPIEVHFRCTYDQCRDFFKRLEGLQRLSSVGRLSIEAETDLSGAIGVQLTLFVYNTKTAVSVE